MRVLQVLPDLSAGGAEGFVTNLGVSLSKIGVEVRFFLLAGARGKRGSVLLERLQDAGIEVFGIEERNIRSLKNVLLLVRLIRTWQPDIVQANLYPAEIICILSKWLIFRKETCFVRRLANSNFWDYRSPTIIRLLDRFFPLTISCSAAVEKSYFNFMNCKPRSATSTISNGGLLCSKIPSIHEKNDERRKLGIPESAFVVTHIGRMTGLNGFGAPSLQHDQKAHDVLLKCFAKAFASDIHKVLVLVGDGNLHPKVLSLAQDLGVIEQVRFLGIQPEPWPALIIADVFCFPSRYEGSPNVLPEAASCGLPVVASDIPEIRNLCLGDTWLLKPVDDISSFAEGLNEIAKKITEYKRRSEALAPAFLKHFSIERCAERYREAYTVATTSIQKGRKTE